MHPANVALCKYEDLFAIASPQAVYLYIGCQPFLTVWLQLLPRGTPPRTLLLAYTRTTRTLPVFLGFL
jgi:hypothetical protein